MDTDVGPEKMKQVQLLLFCAILSTSCLRYQTEVFKEPKAPLQWVEVSSNAFQLTLQPGDWLRYEVYGFSNTWIIIDAAQACIAQTNVVTQFDSGLSLPLTGNTIEEAQFLEILHCLWRRKNPTNQETDFLYLTFRDQVELFYDSDVRWERMELLSRKIKWFYIKDASNRTRETSQPPAAPSPPAAPQKVDGQ